MDKRVIKNHRWNCKRGHTIGEAYMVCALCKILDGGDSVSKMELKRVSLYKVKEEKNEFE